jgi:urea transport system substrate-binding protein
VTSHTKGALNAACGTLAAHAHSNPSALPLRHRQSGTVKIGVLHSLSGTMAISETSLRDVVLMAVDQINAEGRREGRGKELHHRAGRRRPREQLAAVCRKSQAVDRAGQGCRHLRLLDQREPQVGLPVFEAKYTAEENPYGGGLLFYPVQYEGEEQSPNVFYTGASPNEQLIPAAEYMMSKDGGSKKKFYLLGTDYVFPRTANKVLKAFLKSQGRAR